MSDGCGSVSDQVLHLTDNLCEHDGIIVYDPSRSDCAAANEYWFKNDPRDAVLLVVTIKSRED